MPNSKQPRDAIDETYQRVLHVSTSLLEQTLTSNAILPYRSMSRADRTLPPEAMHTIGGSGSTDDLNTMDGSQARLLDEVDWEKTSLSTTKHSSLGFCRRHCKTILNICLFLTSCVFFLTSFQNTPRHNNNWLLRQTSFYSPILSRYDIDLEQKTVVGPLFNEDSLSPEEALLRSYPSPESEALWCEYEEIGTLVISSDEVRRLGKDPETTVKAPVEFGYGPDAHLAMLDGQHAIHCLNTLRRYAYREYFYPNLTTTSSSPPGKSPFSPLAEAHLSHCIHILLQTLTCKPSFDLITMNWVETQINPYPNFAINKKCVDYKQMKAWQTKNKLSKEQWLEVGNRGPQRGDKVFPMAPKLADWVKSMGTEKKQAHD
ncbi:Putative mycotoxin biosynthesis protein UstYa [Septoria linicola]|uniref:Mycotoxin biosynthesis protein UstYa n=1 Tax=Septoria linicola TaxID=215465 RepID=A0A9Q9ELM1_9PEZI|nr:Putative mycotoxin biosynthesis protein UstYa [Septoria linicola]